MSNAGDNEEEISSPPPKGDASCGKTTPVVGTPKGLRVEQLSSELMQLKLERKINKFMKKLKDSKSRQLTSSSSTNEETDDSSEEVKGKGKRGRREIRDPTIILHLTMIICLPLTLLPRYPLVKPPILIGWTIPNGDT
jgi:hypothetical protein